MSFLRSRRFSETTGEETPGPGHYNINLNAVKKGPIEYKICRSPRFPQECRRKSNGVRECSRCSYADSASTTQCHNHFLNRSANSSMNSSFESVVPRRRLKTLDRSHKSDRRLFEIYSDLSNVRQDLENLLGKQISGRPRDNTTDKSDNKSKGMKLAPSCIHVTDSTDTEDEINEIANDFSTELRVEEQRTSSAHSCEEASSIEDSGIQSSHHSSAESTSSESISRPPSAYSEAVPIGDDLPPYTEQTRAEEVAVDSQDSYDFSSGGKSCEEYKRILAARQMRELENMMRVHAMGLQKMHNLVNEVKQTIVAEDLASSETD